MQISRRQKWSFSTRTERRDEINGWIKGWVKSKTLEEAKRELTEETGFSAAEWQKLGEITPVPGYSDERIHIFLAAELSSANQQLDKDEVLNVHELNLADAIEMIYAGVIQDGKTIAGLLLANHWLKEKRKAE